MIVDLRECNVRWINLDKNTENAKAMTEMCDRLGLVKHKRKAARVIPAPFNTPDSIAHFRGCGQSHIDIFEDTTVPCPLLTLEEDVEATPDFYHVLNVPDDTAAVYLGVSTGSPNYISRQEGPNFYRIGRMLAHHAVLYLSEAYRKEVVEISKHCINTLGIPFDVGTASIQERYRVLTPVKPMFYQADRRQSANKWQYFTDKEIVDRGSVFKD